MTHAQQVDAENKRLLQKGQVAREIEALGNGYLAMKEKEEAEEAYVLVFADGCVGTTRRTLPQTRQMAYAGDIICRLEPVEVRS